MASFALVWLIGWWSLRPLARASRQAAAIGPANPAGRLNTGKLPREIRPLVNAVNGALERLDHAYAAQRELIERLDHAYAAQRRLTADAAHELRTPLAVLSLRLQRAKLDAAADWPAMERDLTQMSRLVGQLLELARVEDPARLKDSAGLGPVNLARLAARRRRWCYRSPRRGAGRSRSRRRPSSPSPAGPTSCVMRCAT